MWIPLADWGHESLGRPYCSGLGGAMIAKKLVLAGAVAAVLLGGGAVVLDQMAPVGETPPIAGAGPTASESGHPHPSEPGSSATAGAEEPTETPAASAAPSEAATSPAASDPAGSRVLEVLPPASAAPTGLPMPSPPNPLIRTPLPTSGSAQGKIVDGFPVNVVTFPDRTVLVSTSVSSSEKTLQVTGDGIVELSTAQVTGHFQQTLLALGFQPEAVTAVDGQQSIRLTRGTDTVTVAITTTGTGSTRFTLLGNLHA